MGKLAARTGEGGRSGAREWEWETWRHSLYIAEPMAAYIFKNVCASA